MEAYSKFTKDTHTLNTSNNCRIHLKDIILSHITSADKKKLIKTQLNGHQSPSFTSELVWPKQKRPDKKSWEIFKQVNQYIFCHKTSYTLKKPLGKWKQTKYPQNSWNHFYNPTQNRLLKYHNRIISP